jgi:hypothetical protein
MSLRQADELTARLREAIESLRVGQRAEASSTIGVEPVGTRV